MKKTVALLLLLLMLSAIFVGCDTGGVNNPSGRDTTVDTEEENNPYGYVYPEEGFNGRSLNILNPDAMWSYYVSLSFEEMPVDPVDGAIYSRNCRLEEKYDFTLNVDLLNSPEEIVDRAEELYLAQDDEYDVIYLQICRMPSLISEGALTDLETIDSLQLDKEWWDGQIRESTLIQGKSYLATGAFQLSAYDGTWAVYFNENMLENMNMEKPYQSVKDGTWTLDLFSEYAKAVTNLNGDETFAWDERGKATYGVAAHEDSVNYFARGAGVVYATCSDDGEFVVEKGSEEYFNTFEKLAGFLNENTGVTHVGSVHTNYSYVPCFTNERALFFLSGLDACRGMMRNIEFTYGILPFPKYDEAQEQYHSLLDVYSIFMTIPSTNQDNEEVGLLMDMLTYQSYVSVIPVYYDIAVEQKGLRNEESREMLSYINKGRTTDIALLYNCAEQLRGETAQKIYRGDYKSLASLLESQRTGIQRRLMVLFGTDD